MKNRGRSFYFASRFLDQTTAERAARLYEFCRAIDDIADRSTSKNEARDRLDQTLAELKGSVPTGKLTKQLFLLAEDTDLDPRAAIELVKGCRSDLSDEVLIPNEEQLIQYCYQVAGERRHHDVCCPGGEGPSSYTARNRSGNWNAANKYHERYFRGCSL